MLNLVQTNELEEEEEEEISPWLYKQNALLELIGSFELDMTNICGKGYRIYEKYTGATPNLLDSVNDFIEVY